MSIPITTTTHDRTIFPHHSTPNVLTALPGSVKLEKREWLKVAIEREGYLNHDTGTVPLPMRSLRYDLLSSSSMEMHWDLPSITIRGALGRALMRRAPEGEPTTGSALNELFGEKSTTAAANPRCYVVRGLPVGDDHTRFALEVLLFGVGCRAEQEVDAAVKSLGTLGIGPDRTPCQVIALDAESITPTISSDETLTVEFITPVRIRADKQFLQEIVPFQPLYSRLQDRLNGLLAEFDPTAPLFPGELKQAAHRIECLRLEGRRQRLSRRSGRTQKIQRLDGFQGMMSYMGDLDPFRPVLQYLPWIHVGKGCVNGSGWAEIYPIAYPETEGNR